MPERHKDERHLSHRTVPRRGRVRGWRPLRRDTGDRPNDRLAGKGNITPLDADLAHREQLLELETIGAHGCERIPLFRFAAFGDRRAHLAGMLAVKGFHDTVAEAVGLGIFDEHFRPRDPLQNAPVPATQMEEGSDNEDGTNNPHAGLVVAIVAPVNRQPK